MNHSLSHCVGLKEKRNRLSSRWRAECGGIIETSDHILNGSLKLLTSWGSIRVSHRPYGPEGSSQFYTIVISVDSPNSQLHPLGAPYMSEGLQSTSFRVIPNSSVDIGSTTSVGDGRPQTQSITTYSRGSNLGQDG